MEHAPPTPGLPGLGRSLKGTAGRSRLRVVPWQGDRFTALVGPRRDGRVPHSVDVARCIDHFRERGVAQAVTPALTPLDSQPFLEAGFSLHERLHLLSRPISNPTPRGGRPISTGRPWHRRAVLTIDQRAFEPFWQFDRATLSEARRATPVSRFRISREDGRVAGYAVTGRAGPRGYLQRLAVDPDVSGSGHGTDLVNDAIHWLQRRGATSALVNTQEKNKRALALYERLGFVRHDQGLLVLRWENR